MILCVQEADEEDSYEDEDDDEVNIDVIYSPPLVFFILFLIAFVFSIRSRCFRFSIVCHKYALFELGHFH